VSEDASLGEALYERLLPLIGCGSTIGLAAVAVTPVGEAIVCHGHADVCPIPRGVDDETVFEIGSVTKLFTALLLAQMVEAGDVALCDCVSCFLPFSAGARRSSPGDITLLDLATHTAGLPFMPFNAYAGAIRRWPDPLAGYTPDHLVRAMSRTRPVAAAYRHYHYSHFGYAVLGHVLSVVAGETYSRMLAERVCQPLGMGTTCVTLSEDALARRASGHRRGKRVRSWNLGPFVPAGGLNTTARDLLRFLHAQLWPEATPLAAALTLARRRHRAISPETWMDLGWPERVEQGQTLTWHHGVTAGSRSMVAMNRDARTGIVVMVNSRTSHGTELHKAAVDALRAISRQRS
jgi:D-alanyl-D-alanine-carboxypeptidase/D-alanyl-D-alanine-endopeptidase